MQTNQFPKTQHVERQNVQWSQFQTARGSAKERICFAEPLMSMTMQHVCAKSALTDESAVGNYSCQ
jgi:hypothetical protein